MRRTELALISVIIPAYNVEQNLDECMKSLIEQTYSNIEVILIDDGSTDNTGNICDKWAQNYDNVKVIHQENSGVSAARNAGIGIAQGDYIGFIDADDTIDSTMYEKLAKQFDDCMVDMVICGYTVIGTRQIQKGVLEHRVINLHNESNMFVELFDSGLMKVLWNKLYRKKYISKFDISMAIGEDVLFNLDYLSRTSTVSVIPEALYRYVKRIGAATSRFKVQYVENCINKNQALHCFIKDNYNEENILMWQREKSWNEINHLLTSVIMTDIPSHKKKECFEQVCQLDVFCDFWRQMDGLTPLPSPTGESLYRYYNKRTIIARGKKIVLNLLKSINRSWRKGQ